MLLKAVHGEASSVNSTFFQQTLSHLKDWKQAKPAKILNGYALGETRLDDKGRTPLIDRTIQIHLIEWVLAVCLRIPPPPPPPHCLSGLWEEKISTEKFDTLPPSIPLSLSIYLSLSSATFFLSSSFLSSPTRRISRPFKEKDPMPQKARDEIETVLEFCFWFVAFPKDSFSRIYVTYQFINNHIHVSFILSQVDSSLLSEPPVS